MIHYLYNNQHHEFSVSTKQTLSTEEQIDTFDYVEIKFYSTKSTIKNLRVQNCDRKLTCKTKINIGLVSKILKNKSETIANVKIAKECRQLREYRILRSIMKC